MEPDISIGISIRILKRRRFHWQMAEDTLWTEMKKNKCEAKMEIEIEIDEFSVRSCAYCQWLHEHPIGLSVGRVEDGTPTPKHHNWHLAVHRCPCVLAFAPSNYHCPRAEAYSLFCWPIPVSLNDESTWKVLDEFVLQLKPKMKWFRIELMKNMRNSLVWPEMSALRSDVTRMSSVVNFVHSRNMNSPSFNG